MRRTGHLCLQLSGLFVWIDDVSLTKEFILVIRIKEAFHQLLFVPTEMVQ